MKTLTRTGALERAAGLSVPAGGRPFLLGIVGAPGAGKSTLAEAIADALGAPILPMDGFHLANEHLDRLGRRDRKGAPDTFDVAGYAALLRRLRGGEDVLAPRFDRTIDAAVAGAIPVPAASRLVLTEGNYLLHERAGWERIRPLLDEVWFLDVPDGVRVPRLVARHEAFGRDHDDAVRWAAEVDGPNAALIHGTRDRADALVVLDLPSDPDITPTQGEEQ